MSEFIPRFPRYDVLSKRHTPSWNEQTRRVVEKRRRDIPARRFFDPHEWATLEAIGARIIPQPDRSDSPVPIAPFIDAKLFEDRTDGTRYAGMPPLQEAWRQGLQGIDEESRRRFGDSFCDLPPERQDDILRAVQQGEVESDGWRQLPAAQFFKSRLLHDIVSVYYAHPAAWSEIGFGGPASPRGYVRLRPDRHDPWEAAEEYDER
ncbi:MAG: gluconate 2-dehydrogenase subunit 3 family protein [Desulfobacterales bacterium]